jgi:hypothetical protein
MDEESFGGIETTEGMEFRRESPVHAWTLIQTGKKKMSKNLSNCNDYRVSKTLLCKNCLLLVMVMMNNQIKDLQYTYKEENIESDPSSNL